MNTENLNRWLSLAANFGVVAGIIFLAIEIRQNQESLDRNSDLVELDYQLNVAEGQIAIAEMSNTMRVLRIENAEVAKIWLDGNQGRELSPVDQSRYDALCGASIWIGATTYGRNVALGRHELAEAEAITRRSRIESQPGFKKCWEGMADTVRLWGYGELVDAISNPPQND